MATATAIGADVVITTDGVEGITTAGGIVTTDGWFRSSKEVASAGGLFHFSRGVSFSRASSSTMRCHNALIMSFMTSASCQRSDNSAPSGPVMA